jgi:hypothetical protein
VGCHIPPTVIDDPETKCGGNAGACEVRYEKLLRRHRQAAETTRDPKPKSATATRPAKEDNLESCEQLFGRERKLAP